MTPNTENTEESSMIRHKRPATPLGRREFLSLAAAGGGILAARQSSLGAATLQASETPAGAKPGDWALFGCDIRGTRFNASEKIISPANAERLKVKWTFDQAGDVSQTTPIVAGGNLYFAAHDGYVYSVDTQSGAMKWKFDAWKGIDPDKVPMKQSEFRSNVFRDMRGSAGYADGRIFIGDGTARFHCLDAATGSEIWKTVMDPQAGVLQSLISSSPIIYGGKIFIGLSTTAGRSYIACLDARTGAIRWRFDTVPDPKAAGGGSIWTAAALDPEQGIVYNVTGSVHGHVPGPILFSESMIANDMESGELLWFDQLRPNDPFDLDFSCHPTLFETRDPIRPAVVRRCVGAGSKTGFHCFDRYTGQPYWHTMVTNGGPTLNATAYGYDKIYMVSNSSADHRPGMSASVALHSYTGEVLWWTPNNSTVQGAVALANGLFYQGFSDGSLQALEAETGKPLWTFKLAGARRGGITVSNGVVYTSCGSEKKGPFTLYAFSVDGK